MADLSGVKVGDRLWLVPRDTRRVGRAVEVLRVGKKYVYHTSGTAVIKTGFGVELWAELFLSEEAYQLDAQRREAWGYLGRRISSTAYPPAAATIDNIKQARALLGLGEDHG